jgi:hypothetical protein
MNKRLEKEIGEKLVEKHGWHWALTSFAFESWGESEGISQKRPSLDVARPFL